jgi:ferredoxin-NADP reductase
VLRTTPSLRRPDAGYYRITVKREHDGANSRYLHTRLAVGDHGARSSRDHSFAAETRTLLASLPKVRAHVYYGRLVRTTSEAVTSTARAV